MLHCNELAYCIMLEWPHLVRNQDFWVAHPIEPGTLHQIGDAWIPQWNPTDIPQPTEKDFKRLWDKHGEQALAMLVSDEVRLRRDAALQEADGLIGRAEDAEDIELLKALRAYRKALRDLPQQPGFPFSITWPSAP
jgi:hypothetical protein